MDALTSERPGVHSIPKQTGPLEVLNQVGPLKEGRPEKVSPLDNEVRR